MSSQDDLGSLDDVPPVIRESGTDPEFSDPGLPPYPFVTTVPAVIQIEKMQSHDVGFGSAIEQRLVSESRPQPLVPAVSKPAPIPGGQPLRPHTRQVAQSDPSLRPDFEVFWQEVQSDVEKLRDEASSEENVKQLTRQLHQALSVFPPRLLAFDADRSGPSEQFVRVTGSVSDSVWFIGDLHGDLLSYVALTNFIRSQEDTGGTGEHYKICFLGDIVDRGPYDIPLLYSLLHGFLERPCHFAFVVGNHDDGIYRDQARREWRSTVDPSDFCDRLNELPPESPVHGLVDEAVIFFRQAPRALLFPDGLLVAHGGVPHVDLLEQLNTPEDLNSQLMLSDFVWTRLHESARRKVPNRTTRGCSLGFDDFNAFCDRAAMILERPITAMLRGHDHVAERYLIHDRYPLRSVVTINAMCRKQSGDVFGPHDRKPVAVRWREGYPLEIFQLEIPSQLIERFYPRATTTGEPSRSDMTESC